MLARLHGFCGHAATALFLLLFATVLAQVVWRYAFGQPLIWSEELSRYLFVWIALLGWVMAARARSHIALNFAVDRLPRAGRLAFALLAESSVLVFAGLLVWFGFALTRRNIGLPTVTLFFDYALVYAIVPAAASVLALTALARMAALVRGGGP